MKKYFYSVFWVIMALPMNATLRTEAQAAAMAFQYFTSTTTSSMAKVPAKVVPVRLVQTINFKQQAQPAIYIYQQENSNSTCVFIASSDKIDRVLGYTDAPVTCSQLPIALEIWLQSYADEIALLEAGEGLIHQITSGRTPIAPILKDENGDLIQWNQRTPYNLNCPYLGGEQTVTGCTATAVAQIMRYYAYPNRPMGSTSYKWKKGQDSLFIDYDTVPDYNWSLMKNKESAYTTTAQKKAVSQLMRDVGYAINMDYGPSSGASPFNCLTSLPTYFGYSTDIFEIGALSLPTQEYEDLVYSSLEKKHPILLYGYTINDSGHTFVCDGADDKGYFHINWGWGGRYDGYFDLSILDSQGTGMGGSTAAGGYCARRNAIFNILPPTEHDIVTKPSNLHSLSADSITISTSILQKNETLTVYVGKIVNTQGEPWSGCYGVVLSGDNMSSRWIGGQSSITNFKPHYTLSKTANITYASLIQCCTQPGVYYLKPSYKTDTDGAKTKTMPIAFGPDKVKLTLDNNGVFIVELESDTTKPTPLKPTFQTILLDLENDSAAVMWDCTMPFAYCDYTITADDQSIELSGRSISKDGDVMFRYYTNSKLSLTVTAYNEDGQLIGSDTDDITPTIKTDFTPVNTLHEIDSTSIHFFWMGEAPYYQIILYQGATAITQGELVEPQEGVFTYDYSPILSPGTYKLGLRPVSPTKKVYLALEKKYNFTIPTPSPTNLNTYISNRKGEVIKIIKQRKVTILREGREYTIEGQPIN